MKGGYAYKFRGKRFSFTLIIVVFTTIFFWSTWSVEKRPFTSNILSDQYVFPDSGGRGLHTDSHVNKEFEKPNDRTPVLEELNHSHEEAGHETNIDTGGIKNVDSAGTVSSESEDDRDLVSSGRKEVDENLVSSSERTKAAKNSVSSFDTKEDNTNLRSSLDRDIDNMNFLSSDRKECNYAKGRWIVDRRRPLYSGFKCKHWLSEMWACRLTQRPDFSYEAYRWQPRDCEIPEFNGSAFLKRMQDKTIALVGDSLGRQQFQSLMCMVTGGEEHPEVEDIGNEYGFVLAPGAARPNGWAFRFPDTNTTILYHWSSCLCDLEPLNAADPNSEVAMHLDRPAAFLTKYFHRFDVLVLNTGHHWNRGKVNANRWVMYIDGKRNENKRLAMIGNAKNLTIHSVVKWLDSQLPQHPGLKAFFRTISPRHFFNGEWNTGGSCENTTPLARGSEVDQDESSDPVIATAVQGTKVKLLDITALSQLRDEGHISRYSIKASQGIQDCLHWCLPGVPDIWNEILAAQI